MGNKTIEFFWDPGSTNTYFALKLIKPILERTGAELVLQPFNLGYAFRFYDYVLMNEPDVKIANRKRDLMRWAKKYNLPFRFPDKFPIKTSRILRGAIAMRQWGLEAVYTEAVLDAYWERNDANIEDFEGLRLIAENLGIDPDEFQRASESDDIRDALIESTNSGINKGVFGVPTFVVNGELFWGKDRMDFIEDELIQRNTSA